MKTGRESIKLDASYNLELSKLVWELQKEYLDACQSDKFYVTSNLFMNLKVETFEWQFFDSTHQDPWTKEHEIKRIPFPNEEIGWADMSWSTKPLKDFKSEWKGLDFMSKSNKKLFQWLYFHLTRFLLMEKFPALVDWIVLDPAASKSSSVQTKFLQHVHALKAGFKEKWCQLFTQSKGTETWVDVDLDGEESTFLTPLSVPTQSNHLCALS